MVKRNALVSSTIALALMAVAPACSKSGQTQNAAHPMTPAAAERVERLSDAQIWQVAEAINHGEVLAARVAERRAEHPATKDFAKHMLQAHADEERIERDSAKRLGLKPDASSVSKRLTTTAQEDVKKLETANRSDFDRTYLDAQVRDHREALGIIDSQLLPQARDPQLKAELTGLRARVAEHLTEAERAQQKLGRK